MSAGLLEGDFDLPARDKLPNDPQRIPYGISAQQSLRRELAEGIRRQSPSDRYDGHSPIAPHRRRPANLDHALSFATRAGNRNLSPACDGLLQYIRKV